MLTTERTIIDQGNNSESRRPSRIVPVSVIVPFFGNEHTIRRAFASICDQTVRPKEVIFVDDCSQDNTKEIVGEFAREFPDWILVITAKQNVGPASARNLGWDKASQRYIAFLDADDAWHRQKLEIQFEWLTANPNAIICGHLCAEYRVGLESAAAANPTVKQITLARMLLGNCFSTPSIVLRRDLSYRFPESKRYSEDYQLWLSIAAREGSIHRIESVLAWYFKSPYGHSGLSGALWQMEKGELGSIAMLKATGQISRLTWVLVSALSIGKYLMRLFRNQIS